MKITRERLKDIIREELAFTEEGMKDATAPGDVRIAKAKDVLVIFDYFDRLINTPSEFQQFMFDFEDVMSDWVRG